MGVSTSEMACRAGPGHRCPVSGRALKLDEVIAESMPEWWIPNIARIADKVTQS
jgi:hypothetical protein